jgi:nucleotide-binding universal stress UspA family protein
VILVAYDGSADARAAIDHAGALLHGQPAIVLTVWESFIDVMTRTGAGYSLGVGAFDFDAGRVDAENEQAAARRAQEGAERARRAGLAAEARTRCRAGSIAATILDEADAAHADAVVLGTRGLTGLKSLLLGSVSHAVLQHADRAVIVVPSHEVASERAAERHR